MKVSKSGLLILGGSLAALAYAWSAKASGPAVSVGDAVSWDQDVAGAGNVSFAGRVAKITADVLSVTVMHAYGALSAQQYVGKTIHVVPASVRRFRVTEYAERE